LIEGKEEDGIFPLLFCQVEMKKRNNEEEKMKNGSWILQLQEGG